MTTDRPLRYQSFKVHKRDLREEDYEDAFAIDAKRGRFAVADGASESSFAGLWARLLTEGFVHASPQQELAVWMKPLRQKWAAEVDGAELPWYGEEKRDLGAFATFLGLAIDKSSSKPGGRWTVQCVGDSCFFHVRNDALLASFPLQHASEFGNQPALLCSRAGKLKEPTVQQATGRWEPGDHLFLMTDALAHWFLRRCEAKLLPWQSLEQRLAKGKPEATMVEYVEKLRTQSDLRNDDVTMLAIHL